MYRLPTGYAVRVYGGVRYYYCETTDDGWLVGVVPADIAVEDITVVPVPAWGET